MSSYIRPEQRAKILSAIREAGMSIIDAAKTFLVPENVILKVLRRASRAGTRPPTEIERLRQEAQELRAIIAKMRRGWNPLDDGRTKAGT
jgi:transposase